MDRLSGLVLPFEGHAPVIADDAFMAPGSAVIGRTTLSAGVTIWFGAVLRADHEDIVIGEGTNIQDNSVMHADPGRPATIGADVTVGHSVTLHGCTVGDRCLIGMGSTIMNGAVIGEESLVAAGSLITEGKTFPPGVMIAGSPAQVRRELSAEERANLPRSAHFYRALAGRYLAG
ncbi:MAG: dapH [Jatrophihabitantaceae bacterium]|nr:dapH [Jatrophihabitantaceae bacterium]